MTTRQTPKAPDLTPDQIRNLSPAARDAYFTQKAQEGVDPSSPFFGLFREWLAQIKGKQQSSQIGHQNVEASTQGRDVQYVQGLQPSTADYQGNEHTQLKSFVDNNLDVEQVSKVSTAFFGVHQAFEDFAKTLSTAVNQSKGTWEGPAAESAQTYFNSLSKWSDANSQNARLASEVVYDQGTAAQTAKNSMPDPIPFSWGDEFKSWATSNPLDLADNIDKSLQKQKDSQAAHEQAAGVMSTYDKNLYEAASKQPAFAPPPSFNAGGGGDSNSSSNSSSSSSSHSVNVPSGNPGSIPSGGSNFGGGNFGGGPNITGPTGSPHFPTGPGSTTGSGLTPVGTTTPSSFVPGGVPSSSTLNPNTSMGGMPMTPMPMGGMNNFGDAEYNSKLGGGGGSVSGGGRGGFGPGGGAGAGAAGNSTGAGGASGAARPGGIGAAEAAAGRGMGGLGSRGGMGAGGGMPRGQHAEGDEDTEHSRPTYLVEGDPDEVFGTDMRTAPPVIGE